MIDLRSRSNSRVWKKLWNLGAVLLGTGNRSSGDVAVKEIGAAIELWGWDRRPYDVGESENLRFMMRDS